MTDALRGALVALVNTVGAMLVAFHVVLSDAQIASVGGFVNAAGVVWLVYRHRTADVPK
jgi:hypothetical protein